MKFAYWHHISMFNKKPKLNPKIRFQKSEFRRQLQSARGYKRNRSFEALKKFINGLGHWLWMTPIVFAAAAVIYLLYIPNFLFIKTIDINGLSPEQRQETVNIINSYLSSRPLLNQKNILLLSKKGLSEYILDHNSDVLQILQIKKSFPNAVVINAQPRIIEFLLKSPTQQILVSNDGYAQQDIPIFASSTASSTLSQFPSATLINTNSTTTIDVGSKVFTSNIINAIIQLKSQTSAKLHLSVDYFFINEFDSAYLTEHLNAGFDIKIDTSTDIGKTLDQIQLILNNAQDSQRKNLYYIDMRYQDRGFVCLKGSSCAN